MKPVIYVANVAETDLATPESNPHVKNVMELASELQSGIVTVSAQVLEIAKNSFSEYVWVLKPLDVVNKYFNSRLSQS